MFLMIFQQKGADLSTDSTGNWEFKNLEMMMPTSATIKITSED